MISLLRSTGISPVLHDCRAPTTFRLHARSTSTRSPSASISVPTRICKGILTSERYASAVICRAEPRAQLSVTDYVSLLSKASSAWEKYDKDRNGTMSLKECEDIFNSSEICDAFETLTNMSHRHYTAADLEPYFKRADRDFSGTLSRTEFLALYLAVVGDRIKRNPLLLAEALLGFIDKDKNGVLEGNELKALLAILGFAPALLLPIPGFMKIEYRAILKRMGGLLEGGGKKA
ncbi:hypothetical protein PLESTB_000835300 [Pleodorina starrii]|uniref:EF-hand domain-containing protein n=1 Tax=Pleodorina starrii TaxID=330485 RepID=A0A9W6F3E1_9CHLO|nr:hypothetical protein PLESTM_000151100 [Pleodorina starrii]GLC54211.1 hypothetical protein PLESTB_000835300 [Pleodorina starrii]GLC64486.1 hypothetical protein PLESTF_000171400 [Pleodorina starrii]